MCLMMMIIIEVFNNNNILFICIPSFTTVTTPFNGSHPVLFNLIYKYIPSKTQQITVSLFSWRYNPLWLYFHSPVAGFSPLVFEVS
jgi:hypothetical protein